MKRGKKEQRWDLSPGFVLRDDSRGLLTCASLPPALWVLRSPGNEAELRAGRWIVRNQRTGSWRLRGRTTCQLPAAGVYFNPSPKASEPGGWQCEPQSKGRRRWGVTGQLRSRQEEGTFLLPTPFLLFRSSVAWMKPPHRGGWPPLLGPESGADLQTHPQTHPDTTFKLISLTHKIARHTLPSTKWPG